MSHAYLEAPLRIRGPALICHSLVREFRRKDSRNIVAMASSKTIHLLRHGQTEMNVFLDENEEGFEDPLL